MYPLADNQKQAIVNLILAGKRLWNAQPSQEQATGTVFLRTIEDFENAMENPDRAEERTAEPPAAAESVAVAEPNQQNDPQAQTDGPVPPVQPQHVP